MTDETQWGRSESSGPIELPPEVADFRRLGEQSTEWIEDAVRQMRSPPR